MTSVVLSITRGAEFKRDSTHVKYKAHCEKSISDGKSREYFEEIFEFSTKAVMIKRLKIQTKREDDLGKNLVYKTKYVKSLL